MGNNSAINTCCKLNSPDFTNRSNSGNSPRWENLLDRKRLLEAKTKATAMMESSPLPPRPVSPTRKCCAPVRATRNRDALTPLSSHRRRSFRQLAMSPRANQKKLLASLKEAAIQAQLRQQTRSATKIQATTRGFLCRRTFLNLKIKSKRLLQTTNHTCKSLFSEITMEEDLDDSIASLGSFDWSPHSDDTLRIERLGNNDFQLCPRLDDLHKLHQKCHASTSTPETWLGSELSRMQDSFSTLLSRDSALDSPVKRPLRKLSPTRSGSNSSPLATNLRPVEMSCTFDYSSNPALTLPPISPCSFGEPRRKFPALRATCSMSSPRPSVKLEASSPLRRAASRAMLDLGHSSLTSTASRDEPVRRPERCHSPIQR